MFVLQLALPCDPLRRRTLSKNSFNPWQAREMRYLLGYKEHWLMVCLLDVDL